MSWYNQLTFFYRIKSHEDLNLKPEQQLGSDNGEKRANNVDYKNAQVHLPKHYYRKTVESNDKIKDNGISKSYDVKNEAKKVSFEDELVIHSKCAFLVISMD